MLKKLLGFVVLLLVTLAVVAWLGYRPLPARDGLTFSDAPRPDAPSDLVDYFAPLAANNPGMSGVKPLAQGYDAFAMRAVLAAKAGQTIDAQYYIWHDDIAGKLLFKALRDAADRGVRVRLLLDDNNTRGMDALLAHLNAHEHITVRLYNPFMHRDYRALGYISDFLRLNRRMHNKSFSVDNVATIVGGRNIGDEYFGVGEGVMFADLDVLAVGAVVDDVENDFEHYWQSASAYPLNSIITQAPMLTDDPLAAVMQESAARAYLEKIASTDVIRYMRSDEGLPLVWKPARLISDDPVKTLGKTSEQTVLAELEKHTGKVTQRMVLVSPYFVPTKTGTAALVALAQEGIEITILTNSLSATDVAAVHAGYAKYRKALLHAGIALYELKPGSTIEGYRDTGLTGSSGSSLHAKTFAVDGKRIFVGSFNLDPRSAHLNTEMGILVDSEVLAQQLEDELAAGLSEHAYQVVLEEGALVWFSHEGGQTHRYDREPNSSLLKNASVVFLSWLPIEWLL